MLQTNKGRTIKGDKEDGGDEDERKHKHKISTNEKLQEKPRKQPSSCTCFKENEK